GKSFELAYYKALLAAGISFTGKEKSALLSVNNSDKKYLPEISKLLNELGFVVYATSGTAAHVPNAVKTPKINKAVSNELDVLQLIRSGKIGLIINTPTKGGDSHTDGFRIRRAAIEKGIPCITTINTASELLKALHKLKTSDLEIRTVEEWVN
ncbi:MAG: carbamoyl-phosphate synthase large chain, partial [Candidatus Micrarchaeota archaeon]